MRTLLYLPCIFAAIITLASCQKEFEDPSISVIPPASSLDTFRVNIDETVFPTYGISTINSSNVINLVASDVQAFKRVLLTVPSNTTAGSYQLDFFGMAHFAQYYPDTSGFLVSNPGTINIIENNVISKRIRGTFDFTAQSPNGGTAVSVLSNGYFSVKYP